MANIQVKKILLLGLFVVLITCVKFQDHKNLRNLETLVLIDQSKTNPKPVAQVSFSELDNLTIYRNQKIENKILSNVLLYHEIPLILSNKQSFEFKGKALSPSFNESTSYVEFSLISTESNFVRSAIAWIPAGTQQFTVILHLDGVPVGSYELKSIVAGRVANAPEVYYVTEDDRNEVLSQTAPRKPSKFTIQFLQNDLTFQWNRDERNAISKLSFWQEGKVVDLILSNFKSELKVPYEKFASFKPDVQVSVNLFFAYSLSPGLVDRISEYSIPANLSFTPTAHHFADHNSSEFELTNSIPYRIKVNQSIVIKGKAIKSLHNRIIIFNEPTKTFDEYFFDEKRKEYPISEGSQVEKKITFYHKGNYILEVRTADGSPVLNRPIYVGDSYPLVPDFVDLIDANYDQDGDFNAQPQTPTEQKELLLTLINAFRWYFNVQPVTLDEQVSVIAQAHAEDMIKKNYFDHLNPWTNEGPQDRARKAGIRRHIGENLAYSSNITFAHLYLSRSPSHLEIMVSEEFKTVGFGIVRDEKNKGFMIVEDFAGRDYVENPLTGPQITFYKGVTGNVILNSYKYITGQNKRLSLALSQWQNLTAEQKSQTKLEDYLIKKGFKDFSIKTRVLDLTPNFVNEQLARSPLIIPAKLSQTEYGLTFKQINDFFVEVYIAFI